MSWVLNILKTVLRTVAPKAAERLLDLALAEPEPKEEPIPLTWRDVAHQQQQIRDATMPPASPRAITARHAIPPPPLPPPRRPRK